MEICCHLLEIHREKRLLKINDTLTDISLFNCFWSWFSPTCCCFAPTPSGYRCQWECKYPPAIRRFFIVMVEPCARSASEEGEDYSFHHKTKENMTSNGSCLLKTLFKVAKSPIIKPCCVTFDDHPSVINTNKMPTFLVVLPFHLLSMFSKAQLLRHVVLFTCVWDSHSGMDALCRLFPTRRDWKAELKKPSPGPLVRENNDNLSSRRTVWNHPSNNSHTQTHLLFSTTKCTANIVT